MNDALYEQLVTRKSRPMDLVIRILCIAARSRALRRYAFYRFSGSSRYDSSRSSDLLLCISKLDVEYEYTLFEPRSGN